MILICEKNTITDLVDLILLREQLEKEIDKHSQRDQKIIRCGINQTIPLKKLAKKFRISYGRASEIFRRFKQRLQRKKLICNIAKELIPDCYVRYREKIRKKERKLKKEHDEWSKIYEEKRKKETEEAIQYEIRKKSSQLKDHFSHLKPTRYVSKDLTVPIYPPPFVTLKNISDGTRVLVCDPSYGTICRANDPETYDKWLNYLIEQKKCSENT